MKKINFEKISHTHTLPNLNVDFSMGFENNLKWVIPNIPPGKFTPKEIEKQRIQNEEQEKRRKEIELQYEKFGIKMSGELVRELNGLTRAGIMNCKNCLDKATYECTTYTKEALFKKAIELIDKLEPICM